MSNHSGSYMLNSMLVMLEREAYFSEIGPEMTEDFVLHVVGLAYEYDGNPGEVLAGIGERLRICYLCFKRSDELDRGVCASCDR